MNTISGSTGVQAALDGCIVLGKGENGITAYITGRDMEEKSYSVNLEDCFWTIEGESEQVRTSNQREDILNLLPETIEEGMSPKELAEMLEAKASSVRSLLRGMLEDGIVEAHGQGRNRRYIKKEAIL